MLATSWADDVAKNHILAVAQRAPLYGDVVTQRFQGRSADKPAETRIFTKTGWAEASETLNGHQLINGSVSANALYLDGVSLKADKKGALQVDAISASQIAGGQFTSTQFESGKTGFSIDTAGSAEFNHVVMRGRLESSTIQSSLLIVPLIAVPTQAKGRFLTLAEPRKIQPRWRSYSGSTVRLTDLRISEDGLSDYYQDKDKTVLMAGDTHGDVTHSSGEKVNNYYHRFRRLAPRLEVNATYSAPEGSPPWGRHVILVRPRIKILAGRTTMADTGFIYLSYALARRKLGDLLLSRKGTIDGFADEVEIMKNRQLAPRPGGYDDAAGYTRAMAVRVICYPILNPITSLSNQSLSLEVSFQIVQQGSFSVDPLTSLTTSTTIKMDTLS